MTFSIIETKCDTQNTDTRHNGRGLLPCVSFMQTAVYKPLLLSVVMLNVVMLSVMAACLGLR
jgi:hypothetical protein